MSTGATRRPKKKLILSLKKKFNDHEILASEDMSMAAARRCTFASASRWKGLGSNDCLVILCSRFMFDWTFGKESSVFSSSSFHFIQSLAKIWFHFSMWCVDRVPFLIRSLYSVSYAANALAYWWRHGTRMYVRWAFYISVYVRVLISGLCSLAPFPVRAGNQPLESCHAGRSHSAEWLRPDASGGWSCLHREHFRFAVTPSSSLEEKPRRLRDLQPVACLGLSLHFPSAAAARVQASTPAARCY